MNICFIVGKLYIKEDFKFVYNSRVKLSVITLYILINHTNKNYIIAKAYNGKADYIVRNYKNGDNIIFIGKVREEYVEIKDIFNEKL